MIIFDLDGTLIDSAPEIVAAMEHAFRLVVPGRPFLREAFPIGPPLLESIGHLTSDEDERDAIAAAFRERYDASDFEQTVAFPGVDDMLATLASTGRTVAIATNKRWAPTRIILAKRFPGRFPTIACVDRVEPDDGTYPGSKGGMLAWFARRFPDMPLTMVGDAPSDILAGRSVSARTVGVTWGYSSRASLEEAGPDVLVDTLPTLVQELLRSP